MIGNGFDMKRKVLMVFAACAALLCSCGKDSDLKQNAITGEEAMTSLEDTEIPCVGGGITLAFTSDVSWKIEGRPEWLNISPSSGKKGTTTIKISTGVNTYREDRVANLVFQASDGSYSKPFNISQTFPYLKVSADTLSFGWTSARTTRPEVDVNTQTTIIQISSNVKWMFEEVPTKSADVDLNKFAVSAISGEGDQNVEFIPISDNFSPAPYELKVRLFATTVGSNGETVQIPVEAADEYVIKLHQDNLRFLIDDYSGDASVEIGELNDADDLNLSIDSEVEWKVSECPDWVVVDKTSGTGEVTLNIRADGVNPLREIRSGILRLGTVSGAYRDIYVSQKGYKLDADVDRINILNDDTNEITFNLSTSGPWEIKSVPSWLEVSPLSGEESAKITVRAKGQNYDLADLSSDINISSKLNELVESVPITQERFLFDLTSDSELADLPTLNIKKYSVVMRSSGGWEIKDKPAWLDISRMSGDKGETSFTVGPNSGNPDTRTDREAELVFVSVTHRNLGISVEKSMKVKQRKYTFSVDGSSIANTVIPAYDESFGTNSSKSYSVPVDCSVKWEITSCPEWLKPSVTSGDGTPHVVVKFTPLNNTQKSSRSATVVFRSEMNDTREFSVRQDEFVFDNEDKSFDVPVMNSDTYSVTFDLTADVPWTIQPYDSWTNPSVKSGKGSGSIVFTPGINANLTGRTGTAVIYCALSGESKTITFAQQPYVFDSTSKTITFTDTPTSSVTESVICSGNWTAQASAAWLTVSASTTKGNGSITITAQNNTAETSRTATVTVTSSDNTTFKKVITVNQDKHETKKKKK